MKVGILAFQGSFAEHAEACRRLKVAPLLIRNKKDFESCTHLILPGGESTTIRKNMEQADLWDPFCERILSGNLFAFGTCAGAILLSYALGDAIKIERNAYGAQQASFEAILESEIFPNLKGVFIRAPRFLAWDDATKVLASFQGEAVMLERGNLLLATFHPELTDDLRVHQYFLGKK